jgi:tRNA (guanine-N7-)-methyltransferase
VIHLKTDNTELHKFTLSVIRKYDLELLLSTDDLYGNDSPLNEEISALENSLSHTGEPAQFFENILSINTHYEKLFLQKGMKITYLAFRLNREKLSSYGEETAERRE